MKYLFKAIKESKAWIYLILYIIVNVSNIVCGAILLKLIAEYCAASNEVAMSILNKIIFISVIQIVLSVGGRIGNRMRDAIYTNLNNLYANKIAFADTKMFSITSPSNIKTIADSIWNISTIPLLAVNIVRIVAKLMITMFMIYTMVPFWIFCIIVICFVITGILSKIVDKRLNAIDNNAYEKKKIRNAELDEICNGYLDVRSASGKQNMHNKNIHYYNSIIFKIIGRKNVINGAFSATASFLITVAMVIALLYVNNSDITSSVAVTLIMYIFELSDPLMGLTDLISTYSELKICIEKYDEIMNYQNEMKDGSINLSCFESGISLENVSFWYKDGKSETILNNVSMYIPKGSKVGLCGKSGGGKSTILKLIDRLYDPTAGSIKIDGIDIKMIKRESLTSYIGMVPQEIFIFDGTIRDNLTYYCKEKPSDAEILKFCKMCNLDDIIGKNGLDGRVGPRGITLSGGQKQRFGIVRIMLSDPDIILLDEATSALDSDTEHDVMEYFRKTDKTIISVAHRLNTIRHCDMIFSIVDHDVSECGSHEELMQNNDGYYCRQIKKYYKY